MLGKASKPPTADKFLCFPLNDKQLRLLRFLCFFETKGLQEVSPQLGQSLRRSTAHLAAGGCRRLGPGALPRDATGTADGPGGVRRRDRAMEEKPEATKKII